MEFPLADFRLIYEQFADVSDNKIKAIAKQALIFVGDGCPKYFEALWMLMVAHMLLILLPEDQGGIGGTTGSVTSATVDKVSISFSQYQSKSERDAWLKLTQFGQQFLVLLKKCSSGFVYAGGRPERSAFRGVGGRFPNRGRPW